MQRKILYYPDPFLRKKAVPVDVVTPAIQQLATDMAETMYANDGIGLAAPQVGESLRLIVVDISGPAVRDNLLLMVNPVITDKQGEVESEEGCLSVCELRAKVCRALSVTVTYSDMDGMEHTLEAEDMLAVCLQHEIDHLDGVLFIDHISRLKRSLYDKKVRKWERRNTTT